MPKDAPITDLSPVQQPLAQAQGLPNAHYVDPAVFEEEKHAVLFASWAGLAVASDVPEPGDAKPLTFLGIPLLLLRDKDGDVRVFENICRHRGMILVEEPKKIEGAIRCPYHSWCYSTKGALVATPHVGGPGQNTHDAIDKDSLGLNEVRSHIWFDTVFINIDGKAPTFEVANADLLKRWSLTNQPMYHGGPDSAFQLQVQTNWKLAVENYCESYHLPWIHPGLNSYSRLEDHYNIAEPGKYSGQGTLVYQQLKGETGQTLPDFDQLTDDWRSGGEYIAVYPNVLLGVQRDHWFVIVLEPKAFEKETPPNGKRCSKKTSLLWKVCKGAATPQALTAAVLVRQWTAPRIAFTIGSLASTVLIALQSSTRTLPMKHPTMKPPIST